MHIQFHVEASRRVGHGHVMRCVAIAERARERGIRTSFNPVCGYTAALLANIGMEVRTNVSDEPNVVIVDLHRDVEASRIRLHQSLGAKVMLLDQHGPDESPPDGVCNALIPLRQRRSQQDSGSPAYLYGLKYALLRKPFRGLHSQARPGSGRPPRIMISLGGVDPLGVTVRLVRALTGVGFRGPATIVTDGVLCDTLRHEVRHWGETEVLSSVDDMAKLMLQADLLVTKLGVSMMESFCLGLGTAMIEPSKEHVNLSSQLAHEYQPWPALHLGTSQDTDMSSMASKIIQIAGEPSQLRDMGSRGASLIDGLGADRLLEFLTTWVTE